MDVLKREARLKMGRVASPESVLIHLGLTFKYEAELANTTNFDETAALCLVSLFFVLICFNPMFGVIIPFIVSLR